MEDKDLQFLIELGTKMNSQDNRATQFPLFQIRQKTKRYGQYDGCERDENYEGFGLCAECQKIAEDSGMSDLPDNCPDCDDECYRYFVWEDVPVNDCGIFFTAEEAETHIKLNHYHYCEPYVYGISSWRNPEMQKVLEILSKLGGGGEAKPWYK